MEPQYLDAFHDFRKPGQHYLQPPPAVRLINEVCSWTEEPFFIKLEPCGTSCLYCMPFLYNEFVFATHSHLLPGGPHVGLFHPNVFAIYGERGEWSYFPPKVSLPFLSLSLRRRFWIEAMDSHGAMHTEYELSPADKLKFFFFFFFVVCSFFSLVQHWHASAIRMSRILGCYCGYTYQRIICDMF